ncbi:methylated-DNA--[protein]-cysteine S-methyltransferase [bacterium]|nr:methylated-DNA--[protein]-cysteine S-methyltransferase [bacterium]
MSGNRAVFDVRQMEFFGDRAVVAVEFDGELTCVTLALPKNAEDAARAAAARWDRPDVVGGRTPVLDRFFAELEEFVAGQRRAFTVPYRIMGSPFARKVREALLRIPYGETMTYGEIAAGIGIPKASISVGQANAKNPLPFVLPCHRVVGSTPGDLRGYAFGLELKKKLLDLERAHADTKLTPRASLPEVRATL